MNKTLIAAAVLATLGSSAFAQSTVTIYGRLNVTVERQKLGSDDNTVMQNSSSRWGMKGSEDLGGGLKAGFQLENGAHIEQEHEAVTDGRDAADIIPVHAGERLLDWSDGIGRNGAEFARGIDDQRDGALLVFEKDESRARRARRPRKTKPGPQVQGGNHLAPGKDHAVHGGRGVRHRGDMLEQIDVQHILAAHSISRSGELKQNVGFSGIHERGKIGQPTIRPRP
jgi:hypothetical protein